MPTKTKPLVKKTTTSKAKKISAKKVEIKSPQVQPKPCASVCWLCWLFKLMLILFLAMIIFWLGFCFGALSWQAPMNQTSLMMSVGRVDDQEVAKSTANMCLNAPVDTIASNMTSTLQSKQGEDFDKEYLLQMSIQNQGAIEMSKLALEKSSNKTIKKLAQTTIDYSKQGIEDITAWQTKLFKTK